MTQRFEVMALFLTTLKCFRVRFWRVAVFAALAALLSISAGLAGAYFLYGEGVVSPIGIILVDEDDTAEARAFYDILQNVESYKDLLNFEKLNRDEAYAKIRQNRATAAFIIPKGFTESVKSGGNMPFEVVYNEREPLKAGMVGYFSEAFTKMLKASQAGVYAGLDFAAKNGDSADYSAIFRQVNLKYMSLAASRENLADIQEVSVTGQTPVLAYYVLSAYVFLMMCGVALFTDVFHECFGRRVTVMLKRRGIGAFSQAFAFSACYFVVWAGLSAGLFAVAYWLGPGFELSFEPAPAFWAAAALTLMALSSFGVASAFCFKRMFSAGVFVSAVSVVGLFASGGVVPTAFFSEDLAALSRLTLNYQAVSGLSAAFGGSGRLLPLAVWALLLFGAAGLACAWEGRVR